MASKRKVAASGPAEAVWKVLAEEDELVAAQLLLALPDDAFKVLQARVQGSLPAQMAAAQLERDRLEEQQLDAGIQRTVAQLLREAKMEVSSITELLPGLLLMRRATGLYGTSLKKDFSRQAVMMTFR